MENTGVDEDGAELAALEEFIRSLEEDVVGVDHHDAFVLDQTPGVEFVESQFESLVEIVLTLVRILHVLHRHHFDSIFVFPVTEALEIV